MPYNHKEGIFYLTIHSTHFIYGYMALEPYGRMVLNIIIVAMIKNSISISSSNSSNSSISSRSSNSSSNISSSSSSNISSGSFSSNSNSNITSISVSCYISSSILEYVIGSLLLFSRQINPSWGGPIELFLVPASAPRLV